MNSTERSDSCVQCPHCAIDLEIRFLPEYANPAEADHTFAFTAIPDGSGDSIKNQFLRKTEKGQLRKSSIMNQIKEQAQLNTSVLPPPEYTVYKGALLKPPGKRRASISQVEARPYGKNTIFRMPGNATENSFLNSRSRSFTVAPALIYTTNNTTPNKPVTPAVLPTNISRTNTYICPDSHPHTTPRACTNTATTKALEDSIRVLETLSSKGLDSVEIATLYSSPSSSCESMTQRISTNSLPNCCSRSVINSNPSLISLGFSINESDAGVERMPEFVADEVTSDIFDYEDIPKYRQDIYKDCLSLFLEKLFG